MNICVKICEKTHSKRIVRSFLRITILHKCVASCSPWFPLHRRHQFDELQQQEGETGLEHAN